MKKGNKSDFVMLFQIQLTNSERAPFVEKRHIEKLRYSEGSNSRYIGEQGKWSSRSSSGL
jgi:hypothetical protein